MRMMVMLIMMPWDTAIDVCDAYGDDDGAR